MSLYARAGTATDGLLACVRGRLAARAFSASFSQRRPKFPALLGDVGASLPVWRAARIPQPGPGSNLHMTT
jgi:hypothetical protein